MYLSGLLEIFNNEPTLLDLEARLKNRSSPPPLALMPSARAPVAAHIFMSNPRTFLLVTGRVDSVPVWIQALEAWLPAGLELMRFPEPTPLPYERGPWSELSRTMRLGVFSRLMREQHRLVGEPAAPLLIVSSARALLQRTLPKRRFVSLTRFIRSGQLLEMDKTVTEWEKAGYEKTSVVESPGQYSRRGGILDIFPMGSDEPARIEFFGDQVETIRYFDPATQRTVALDNVGSGMLLVPPARELLPCDTPQLGSKLESIARKSKMGLPGWREDVPHLVNGRPMPHLEYYLPMVYSNPGSLLDFLPEDALIVIDDLDGVRKAAEDVHRHAGQIAAEQDGPPPGYPNPLFSWDAFYKSTKAHQTLRLGDGDHDDRTDLADTFRPGPSYGGQIRPFLTQLRLARSRGERTIIVSRQAQRLEELWREYQAPDFEAGGGLRLASDDSDHRIRSDVEFVQGSLTAGFDFESSVGLAEMPVTKVHLLTDAEIFGWKRPLPRRRNKPRPAPPEAFYSDLGPGEYVVHVDYGIGQFTGLVIRAVGGMDREYLQVKFDNGDVLYVPVHHADRISRWVGPDDRKPKLHRLGNKSWKRSKSKAQEAVDDLADELLDLYASREQVPGHAFAPDSQWQAELEASFPYRESEDQLRAIFEVKSDMERPFPMDRLVTGDVGYGKTEVALRAAFKAVMDGKQAALLVPTTVLAQQHYNTFCQRLDAFPVRVEMLSRFRTQTQQEMIVGLLREGQVDIVIGTHRLFSDDVSFKDLGLLIIDEEQRFGVSHKERLKQLRKEVDVLTMTATPIPRTLYMSLSGVRDISIIDTAPSDRLPVQTYVGEADKTIIRRAILRELDRSGQVFYVHNRVLTIRNVLLKLRQLVPEATIAVGHGQMSERELEDVMLRFVNGEIDVLLSTSIIESGLDIPNANTLIVERADQFGLAQLYQLRGRVGRGVRRAYAYFLHPEWRKLKGDAKMRLEVIAAQTELGSGYTLALRDLEIRGAGDLLGSRQSGHIAAVGFDMYTKLLVQAVKHKRATDGRGPIENDISEPAYIDLPLAAYIPTDYVPDASLRLRLYRRMAVIDSMADIDDMAEELADRFGSPPDPVDNLLYQLRIKVMAQRASVSAVTTESGQIQIRPHENGRVNRISLQRFLGQEVRVSRRGIWLPRGLSTREWQIVLVQILEKLDMIGNQEEPRLASPVSSG